MAHDHNSSNHQETWQLSTWAHRAWLTLGCTTILIALTRSITLRAIASTTTTHSWLFHITTTVLGYVAADLATGIYHWAIDNYGSSKTPLFGSQIEDFQSHHQRPWSITSRQLANNLHELAMFATFLLMPINVFCDNPSVLGFAAVFFGCGVLSQQFHAWAHTPKRNLPRIVMVMQEAGVLVGREMHGLHHRPPYDSNYCIVSGMWNRVLDRFRVFLAMEMVVEAVFGVRPRSWGDQKAPKAA